MRVPMRPVREALTVAVGRIGWFHRPAWSREGRCAAFDGCGGLETGPAGARQGQARPADERVCSPHPRGSSRDHTTFPALRLPASIGDPGRCSGLHVQGDRQP